MTVRIWNELPVDIEDRIISFLPRQEIACTVRRLNKAAASRYSDPKHLLVQLSLPVPGHAFLHRWTTCGVRDLPYKKRLHLLCLTATSGAIANVIIAAEATGCVLVGEVMEAAAAAGHVHVCQWLRQQGCPWGQALATAARAGRQEVCHWLLANGCPCDPKAILSAASGGHAGLMDFLFTKLPDPRGIRRLCLPYSAAEGCDLATLQRLMGAPLRGHPLWAGIEGGQLPTLSDRQQELVLAAAAGSPTPDWQAKVEWLERQGCPPTARACRAAASTPGPDALDRVRWLRQRGYPVDVEAVAAAAHVGNLEALEYLLGEVDPREELAEAANAAAEGGQREALRMLMLQGPGCRIDPGRLMTVAAANGHLDAVTWLREALDGAADLQGDQGEERQQWRAAASLAAGAARSGSLAMLWWMYENGYGKWDEQVLTSAASGGCEAALEWLVQRGCEMPSDGLPYVAAACNGDLATLSCLRRLGCPWGAEDTFTRCVGDGLLNGCAPPPALAWMVEAGCPVDWAAAVRAARARRSRNDRSFVAAWLEEQRQTLL